MKARNRQILELLKNEFGTLHGEAYEINGSLWMDIEDDRTADKVHRYLSFECPMSLPWNSFQVQRSSNIRDTPRTQV